MPDDLDQMDRFLKIYNCPKWTRKEIENLNNEYLLNKLNLYTFFQQRKLSAV